ncbi:MAG: 3-hydroxybutyryl-CoA dehydrogenase [Planctomycetes bacterium]|nr:3-hydroxybutyryl-CoA dehydrogenase [Planctomycetota bacterium]
MGSGIAQICAMAGLDVIAVEKEQAFLDKGLGRIKGSLAKLVEKGKLSQATQELALAKLTSSTKVADLADCDLVIEAIVEDLGAKSALLKELGGLCKPATIFGSNTSSFPIAAMGEASGRPARMVGLHFFNPVQLMALVEVVRTEQTAADVFEAVKGFAKAVGKQPVMAKDTPGFVVNRLLVPYLGEAIRMLERGDASKEDIDAGMQLGCGHPMGPITLLDYVELDTTLSILQGWADRFPNDPTFKVPQLLRDMVAKGHLGRKSGRGFYEWEGDKKK